ncbi:MAG TPA: hypothetical protein VGC99_28835 [Candidatus Tectomicrobia bacterium]
MAKPITLQPAKVHTLCFDLPPPVSTALHELRALTGVPFSELVRASVQLLAELGVAEQNGGSVVRLDATGQPVKALLLPRRGLTTIPARGA